MAVNNLFAKAKINLVKPEEGGKEEIDFQENDTRALISKLSKINGKLGEFEYIIEKFISTRCGGQAINDKKFCSIVASMKSNAHIIRHLFDDNHKPSKNSSL